jgi:hypothetical protein
MLNNSYLIIFLPIVGTSLTTARRQIYNPSQVIGTTTHNPLVITPSA